VVGVIVGQIQVQPPTASLEEGDSLQFTAVVTDVNGRTVSGADVLWTSLDPQRLAIDPDGWARARGRGSVTVNATFREETGTASVVIIAAPVIQLRRDTVELAETDTLIFFGAADAQSPAAIVLQVRNGSGSGTLDGLETDVSFRPGEPEGWLTPSLADTVANTTLTLTVQSATLAVGVYHATVTVSSSNDRVDTVSIPVTLSLTGLIITESDGVTSVDESGTTDDFTVRLESQPATDVMLDVTSSDPGEVTVSPERLTFTPLDWDVEQPVTVTGQDDAIADGDVQTLVIVAVDDAASDDAYDPIPDRTVTATTVDNEAGTFIVTESGAGTSVTEAGGTDDFTVVLGVEPLGPVVFDVASADPGEVVVDPSRLTFTAADWSTPQTVTVTGVDDQVIDGLRTTAVTVSVDPAASVDAFDGVAPQTVDVTTSDDDAPGFTVIESGGSTLVDESGTSDEVTVVLTAEPMSDVVLTVSNGDPSEVLVSLAPLTFTPANWNVGQIVTLSGVDDALVDGSQTTVVTFAVDDASSDDAFDAAPDAIVEVITADDDNAGFTLTGTAGLTVSEAGSSDSFSAVLTTAPLSPVVLRASTGDPGEVAIEDPDSLVFTPSNWSTPQPFTVTGVDDLADDGAQTTTITVSVVDASSDDAFDALASQTVQVTTTDDDAAGFVLGGTASLSVAESATTDNFTVVLTTQPASNVVFDVSSGDTGEVTVSRATLTFTPGSWNVAQTVVLTGVDDDVIDGDQTSLITVAVNDAASDDTFDGLSQQVSVVTTDDDVAGLAITELSGTRVSETGTTDEFGVALTAQPATDVSVDVVSTDLGEVTVTPGAITFTPSNWNSVRTVTVTGVDDTIDDDDQVTPVTVTVDNAASDDDFDNLAETVLVTTTDDDGVGFTLTEFGGGTQVSEAAGPGNQDQFGVALDAEPASNVVLDVVSTDVGEATVDKGSLTFTPANWSTLQQVTVIGIDDALVDGAQTTPIVVSVDVALSDATFSGVPPDTVFAQTTDDDGTVTGRVFEDTNGNGIQNGGEPGLANVDVVVTDVLGSLTVTTGPNGDWSATPISAGDATVDVDDTTLPAGAAQTAGTDPNPVTVIAGQSVDAGGDGYQLQGALTGTVYEDVDGDGVRDAGEPGLAGIDVDVTDSLGASRTVTTGAGGTWTANGLPRGPATVDVDDATLPLGAIQTAGIDPSAVTVVAGVTTAAGGDGYQLRGALTGTVFEDIDGDGVQDVGEPGLTGIDVDVTDALGATSTVTTNTIGAWSMSGLPRGTATVDVDDGTLPAGATLTAGTDPSGVTVVAGGTTPAGDDGYQLQGALTGTVFEDTDGNGAQEGEPGLQGVDVDVTDSLGNTTTWTTNVDGVWTASGLPRGPATVDIDDTTLPAFAVQTAGADPSAATVVAGATTAAGDDGYQQPGNLTGTVYEDTDGDGVRDAGEPGLQGVDVVVTDVLASVTTWTTDANGDWTATGLPLGSATVDVDDATLPAGAVQTAGTDPNAVTVVAGASTPAGNDGYQLRGALTGTVFEDTDGDGVQDAGEPGIALIDIDVTDIVGNTTRWTTDASGSWTATDIPDGGDATVDIDDTTLPAGAVQTAGTDPSTATVVAGATTGAGDDGYQLRGALTGTVFEDQNGNGTNQGFEPGIGGADVDVTDFLGNTTTWTTDAFGDWTATGIPDGGDATVDVDDATLPVGAFLTTTGSDPNTVTVIAGASTAAGDDGYQIRGVLTGTVFDDADGDGVRDPGEAGIEGVDVVVTDFFTNPTTWTTDANGDWTATGIPDDGDATVDVDEATLPGGAVQTAGTDPDVVTVVAGQIVAAGDDGYQLLGALTGTVYEDTDGDGVQDAGEPGLAGVDVDVTDFLGNTMTETTDANGDWTATQIPDGGDATIDVDDATLPAGAVLTAGADPNTVTLVGGVTTAAGDDGYQLQGAVTGSVFEDTNADGVRDVGEPGLAGVDVDVIDFLGATTRWTTDAGGDWTASGIPVGGDATVDVDDATLPEGAILTTLGSDPNTVTVVAGATTSAGEDGYEVRGVLTGAVFEDTDGDGVQDPGEPGLAGVDVVVTDVLAAPTTVTTDANGDWSATLMPGDATVDVDEASLPAGAVQTAGTDPDVVTVVAAQSVAAGDDGYQLRGDLTGTVFEDVDGDGVRDAGEPGLAGVDVDVTDFLGNTTGWTTDANGDWTATQVPDGGDASIDIDDTTLPAGATQTAGADPNGVIVVAGATTQAGNDGYQLRGALTGTVFEDANGDGARHGGEPGLQGVAIDITDLVGGTLTVTTNGAGNWTANDLPRGSATVDIDDTTLPAGAAQTSGTDPTNVTVVAGQSVAAGNDGYQLRGTLTGTVFEDADGDGVRDVGELGLPGVSVDVTDFLANTTTWTTDANGDWTATQIPAGGDATVDVDEGSLPAGSTLTAGADPNTVTVVAGATTPAGDDGYQLRGTLTGTVFEDTDGDGVQDAGEPGLPGVEVGVTDLLANTFTATTDANGIWTVNGAPGLATVDVDDATLPAGATLTAGTDPTQVTIVAGATTAAGDDGYQMQGTLAGTVFDDANGNGRQSGNEPGLAGVDVMVTDFLGNTTTWTTDVDGNWTATGIPDGGDATVDVDDTTLPAGAVLTTAGSDPNTVTVVAGATTAAGDDGYQIPSPQQ
jgi:hypothetical protein